MKQDSMVPQTVSFQVCGNDIRQINHVEVYQDGLPHRTVYPSINHVLEYGSGPKETGIATSFWSGISEYCQLLVVRLWPFHFDNAGNVSLVLTRPGIPRSCEAPEEYHVPDSYMIKFHFLNETESNKRDDGMCINKSCLPFTIIIECAQH